MCSSDLRDGLLLAVKELNARGVQVAGRKVSFEVVPQDDAADPRQGVAVAQLLADAHVRYVVGPYNSGVAIPAGRVYNDAGMLMLTVASNPKVTQLGYPRLFRVGVNDAQVGMSMAVHAATKMKAKTVAVIDDRWATVGSSNIDPMSLLLAREANLLIDDADFARELRASLNEAIETGAQPVLRTRWEQQSHTLPMRVMTWLCYGLVRFLSGWSSYGRAREFQ